mgnify:FL=1
MIQSIIKELESNQNEEIQKQVLHFFKEEIKTYGIRNAQVESIAKQYKTDFQKLPKNQVFAMCETLWQSNYIEQCLIACHVTQYIRKQIEESDIHMFSQWIDTYITNWATCDTFCNHTIGDMLMQFPDIIQELTQWTQSENMWKRRAAAVSCIIPARKGMYKEHMFTIAQLLLHDKEDLVQKGYGWLLKETSKPYINDVFNFVMQHKRTMPRTALRYAIEKMPEDMRKQAMRKA